MHEDYINPQENGSHYDCDFVEITNSQFGIAAAADKTFSFNVSVYTQEELERAKHNFELVESESTVLCLDHALTGIGSNSLNVIYLAERITFAAIFSSFRRTVSIRCFLIFADNANRLNQLNIL